MSLKQIQKDVDNWTGQYTPQYWPPYEILARLMEEVGEIGRNLNHMYGVKKKKKREDKSQLGGELCDVLLTVTCLANTHQIDLQKEWDKMVSEKLYKRDKDRFQPVDEPLFD